MRKLVLSWIFSLFVLLFTSCSGVMGYGVLLWNLPKEGLQDGDIVPVYIKSNISHVYVIGTQNGKIEIPLWQLTDPVSKRKAIKSSKIYKDYFHKYAYVALDGLPMRAEPVNTSKQVYRLRKNEVIKVLYKGEGQKVMAGQKPLEGDWLRILTSDGTQGWCFSYNLRLYDVDKTGNAIGVKVETQTEEIDETFENILVKNWYPENYNSMIRTGRVDVNRLDPTQKFSFNKEENKLSFRIKNINNTWEYKGFKKKGINQYILTEIPIEITVRNASFIVIRYTGQDGKPQDFNLVAIEQDLNEIVKAELDRRTKVYEQLYVFGPTFKSQNYGTLIFEENNRFRWANKNLLVPSIIASNAGNTGSVEIKYFLSRALSSAYDGVITFNFDGMQKEVNFLYKLQENGLRLEDATGAVINNGVVTERGLSPLVLFFNKDE